MKNATIKLVLIEWRLETILTRMSDNANPKCEECDGEGIVSYARGEDSEELPCQVCFPETSWEDFQDWDDIDD